jgi:hypothetical protein
MAAGASPDFMVLEDDPRVAVARCSLGFTLYLDDPLTWARDGVVRAFESFLRVAPVERLEWYTTSMIDRWVHTSAATLGALAAALPAGWNASRPRHLFRFRLVDDVHTPGCWFSYREADHARGKRVGHLSVGFPHDTKPSTLLGYVLGVASSESYVCGTAGHVASFNPWTKSTSFGVFHRWSKRYLGLELQDPDRFAWRVRDGLVTTSWLTLLGRPLLERFGVDAPSFARRRFRRAIEAADLRAGLLVRAGAAPTLGDVNQLRLPHEYIEVARVLEPYLMPEPPPMFGPFFAGDDTRKWQRRLVDPEEWQ